jgi:hypothetical protein
MKHYSRILGLGLAIVSLSWAGQAITTGSGVTVTADPVPESYLGVLLLTGFGVVPLLALLKSRGKSATFWKTSRRLGLILTAASCSTAAFTFRTAASGRQDHFMNDPHWTR